MKKRKSTTLSKKRVERKEAREDRKEERKDDRQEARETHKSNREERQADRKKDRQKRKGNRSKKGIVKSAVDELGERLHKNEIRVWKIENKYKQEFPESRHPQWGGIPEIGVCFSGGGTRSATASLGQMRALKKLGLDKKVDILGAISGGAWFATPYTYLPKSIREKDFLGSHVTPHQCDKDWLNKGSKKDNIFAYSVSRSNILFKPWALATLAWNDTLSVFQFRNKRDDESWGKVLGKTFLDPIGKYHTCQRFLSGTKEDRAKILKRNNHLEKNDFDIVERQRPFLVLGGTIINWNLIAKAEKAFTKKGAPIYPMEITPLYSGSNCHYAGSQTAGWSEFGGGYVDPLGFDTPAPRGKIDTPTVKVRPRKNYNRLSVQDAMATTGAAPAFYAIQLSTLATLGAKWLPGLSRAIKLFANALPEYLHWDIERGEKAKARNRQFGDGGFADNLGLIPLLKRGTKRVVVFVNTDSKLKYGPEGIYTGIKLMFGKEDKEDRAILARDRNQVLVSRADPRNGLYGYRETVNGLQRAKLDGGPVVFSGRYRVKKNSWHGVKGGYEVEIAWIYLDQSQQWKKDLNSYAQEQLKKRAFKNFPNYKTFFPKGGNPDVIDLTLPQVQMMSNLTGWTVVEARKRGLLDNIFGPDESVNGKASPSKKARHRHKASR